MSDERFVPAARFRSLTRFFDVFVRILPERSLKQTVVAALPASAQRVLDLGMGTGTLALELKTARPEVVVSGVDLDPEILAQAREKLAAAGVEVDVHEASVDALPFPDGTFDAVVSTLVFHHLTTPLKQRALAEVERVLKPGGTLLIGDFGRPRGAVQRLVSVPARLFDGFDVTEANHKGRIPQLCADAGLEPSPPSHERRTIFGTLALFRAVKA